MSNSYCQGKWFYLQGRDSVIFMVASLSEKYELLIRRICFCRASFSRKKSGSLKSYPPCKMAENIEVHPSYHTLCVNITFSRSAFENIYILIVFTEKAYMYMYNKSLERNVVYIPTTSIHATSWRQNNHGFLLHNLIGRRHSSADSRKTTSCKCFNSPVLALIEDFSSRF